MLEVKKRNGSVVKFDPTKIKKAILERLEIK